MTFWTKVKDWFMKEPDTLIDAFRETIAEEAVEETPVEEKPAAVEKKPRKPRVKKPITVTENPTETVRKPRTKKS